MANEMERALSEEIERQKRIDSYNKDLVRQQALSNAIGRTFADFADKRLRAQLLATEIVWTTLGTTHQLPRRPGQPPARISAASCPYVDAWPSKRSERLHRD